MGLIGHGSKLTIIGPTGSTTINKDLACVSVDFGSNKVDTIDNTDMMTTGTARTKEAGLENAGDVTVKYNVKPGDLSQAALATAKGLMYDFKVVYPGAVRTRAFSGIVSSIDESIPDDKKPSKTAKIDISGPIVDTEGA